MISTADCFVHLLPRIGWSKNLKVDNHGRVILDDRTGMFYGDIPIGEIAG